MPVVSNESATKEKLPFVAKCDKYRCYYRTAHRTAEEAQNILDTHKCPYSAQPSHIMNHFDERGRPYTVLHHAPTMGEKIWPMFDLAVKDLMENGGDEYRKGFARAMARVLYEFVGVHYENEDSLVREGIRRYKFENDLSAVFIPTPGFDYNPPPEGTEAYAAAQRAMMGTGNNGTALDEIQAERAKTQPKQTRRSAPRQKKLIEPHLSEDEIEGIKHAVQMGFALSDLAAMYKTTEDHIARVGKVQN